MSLGQFAFVLCNLMGSLAGGRSRGSGSRGIRDRSRLGVRGLGRGRLSIGDRLGVGDRSRSGRGRLSVGSRLGILSRGIRGGSIRDRSRSVRGRLSISGRLGVHGRSRLSIGGRLGIRSGVSWLRHVARPF